MSMWFWVLIAVMVVGSLTGWSEQLDNWFNGTTRRREIEDEVQRQLKKRGLSESDDIDRNG